MKIFGYEIKKANTITQALTPAWQAGIEHTTPLNYDAMINAYRSWVYVCANKNALAVAQQTLRMYVAKPAKNSKVLQRTKSLSAEKHNYLKTLHTVNRLKSYRMSEDVKEILEHPFLDLLQNVNNFHNMFDLWELTAVYQELVGNAYWYICNNSFGIPEEIWILPANQVTIIPSKENFIKGFIYKNGTTEIPFDPEEIIHFKYANPSDLYYGMSPLAAVTDAYNTNQNIISFTNSLFSNMARPEGVLSTDKQLMEADFTRLKEMWHASYGGANKAKKTAVLTKGLKYTPITMTPQELDYSEGRKVVKEEICNAYGQSLAMYDISANRANSEQANKAYLRDTIQPRLRRIEEKVNEQLMPLYDSNIFVAFDSPVPEDHLFRLKERESNIKSGYSSINQERQLDNKDDVEWGNIPIMPQNMYPLGTAPTAPVKPEDDTKFAIRQIMERIRNERG